MKKVYVFASDSWGTLVFASKVGALNFMREARPMVEDRFQGPQTRREMSKRMETYQISGDHEAFGSFTMTPAWMLNNREGMAVLDEEFDVES